MESLICFSQCQQLCLDVDAGNNAAIPCCDISNDGNIMIAIYIDDTPKLNKWLTTDSLFGLSSFKPFIKWHIVLNQKQICPPHFTCKLYTPYLSVAYIDDPCAYMYHIQVTSINHVTRSTAHSSQITFNVTAIYHYQIWLPHCTQSSHCPHSVLTYRYHNGTYTWQKITMA